MGVVLVMLAPAVILSFMPAFLRDLRFGARLLLKSPVFAVTVVLLLGVGISANTLIFSVVHLLLLKPLPVPHPENLVRLVEVHPNEFLTWDLPYDFCEDVPARDTDFAEVLCQGEANVGFRVGDFTERVRVHLVSSNFFSSLGVQARLGRLLNADDERTRAMNAVVSYDFWKRRLRAEVSAIGRTVDLGGHAFTVVGVSSEGFNGLTVETEPDVRVPASVDRALLERPGEMSPAARPLWAQVFGRLRNGVPFERANAELDSLLHQAYQDEEDRLFPPQKGGAPRGAEIRSRLRLESIANGVSTLRTQFSHGLEILMAGVALLLLMACANVAGLLIGRAATREQEMSIRLAIGASTGGIVRQLLTEGLLLSVLGGVLGGLLTLVSMPLVVRGLPPVRDRAAVLQPTAVHLGIDLPVLGFAMAVTVLTAVLFALSPALRCASVDVSGALRGTRSSGRRSLVSSFLVMAEVALCTVILIEAALLVGTLERMRSMNPGFDADRVVTFTIDPAVRGYTPEQTQVLSKRLLQKAQALPGADVVSIAGRGLMRGTGVKATFGAVGTRISAGDFLNSSLNMVTPEYFETMGIHFVAGVNFDTHIVEAPGSVAPGTAVVTPAVVNQTFVRRFFPGRIRWANGSGASGPAALRPAQTKSSVW